MTSIKAVILDLDQTITADTGSWSQFTQLIGGDLAKHLYLYNSFKQGEIEYKDAKRQLIDLWKEVNTLSKGDIVKVFEQISIRPGAEDAIKYLNKKYKLCIISGAIDVFVEVFSNRLHVNDYYSATKFIFDENNVLVDFDYTLSRGEEKVKYLKKFCSKYKLTPTNCAAVGDGDTDIPIMNLVGLPLLYISQETTEEQKLSIKNHLYNWNDIYKYL